MLWKVVQGLTLYLHSNEHLQHVHTCKMYKKCVLYYGLNSAVDGLHVKKVARHHTGVHVPASSEVIYNYH